MELKNSTENVEIQLIDELKGKGLFAKKNINKGDVIFEETPIVSTQFLWNELYKYKACEYCMKSLETAEEQARRLSTNPHLSLPHPECDITDQSPYVDCPGCQVTYCCELCRKKALDEYHQVLCMGPSRLSEDNDHPLARLQETWRNIHYPPETSSIMLIVKMVALVKQAKDKSTVLQKFSQFVKNTVNEEDEIVHKLLGKQFQEQLELLRQMTADFIFEENVSQWFTPEGFRSLFALIGTNGQGIGSSSISVWVKNCEDLAIPDEEKEQLDAFIDQLYEDMDKVSGTFLDCEGSGLYLLQSTCNHSCIPNAEITFPNNNHKLVLVAKENISQGEEICTCYLSECDVSRSRHSRQKFLKENYLFTCGCVKCLSEADQADVTSEEEEEDEENDME
ncbi:protein-lysine N-trimethyltransferase SMYD5-like [Mytilus galloprovincialis]|uniref:protein-lysine N-trimethyltransferase SMYD5-like n=1 Tax=Mytilus galloprovincialis TaxID=29158 RepID=UPI003F7BE0EE